LPGAEVTRAAIFLFALGLWASPLHAEDVAGDFDYYVLSLSWSPSYCESEGDDRGAQQCSSERPYSFVVHGLWPQYERGWPQFCDSNAPPPTRRQIDALMEIVPEAGLIRHQWRKHGTCSGLTVEAYFDLIRDAYALVRIPDAYRRLNRYTMTAPQDVEKAFIAANPGLQSDGIAVDCDSRRLQEVRICLTKDLEYTDCRDVDRRGCRLGSVVMPPVR
jgi:ribonuclease T2